MGSNEVREPRQKRSIEKKNRIVDAGFKLICEKGYHNTNTAEIAKAAGVSTGIVYNYFSDKKAIFLSAVQLYADSVTSPMYEMLAQLNKPLEMPDILREFIKLSIQSHSISKEAHEEMQAMSHSDKDVAELFHRFEINTANTLVELMRQNGITPTNAHEKVHISIGLIENLCHEIVYHRHETLNYDIMTEEIIRLITGMMSS